MRLIKKSPKGDLSLNVKGTYRKVLDPKGPTVAISCPECGLPFSISFFDVNDDGKVEKLVPCPMYCNFKDQLLLERWRYGDNP